MCARPTIFSQGFLYFSIWQAYESLSDGLGKSASALVQAPLKKYQRGASAGSALAIAVRGVPAAAIAPVSACASAAHYALLGLRNRWVHFTSFWKTPISSSYSRSLRRIHYNYLCTLVSMLAALILSARKSQWTSIWVLLSHEIWIDQNMWISP